MSKFENLFQTCKMSLLSSSRFGGGGGQQQTSELESQIVNTVKQVILNPLLINLANIVRQDISHNFDNRRNCVIYLVKKLKQVLTIHLFKIVDTVKQEFYLLTLCNRIWRQLTSLASGFSPATLQPKTVQVFPAWMTFVLRSSGWKLTR